MRWAVLTLALSVAGPAEARCYSVWHYPWRQTACGGSVTRPAPIKAAYEALKPPPPIDPGPSPEPAPPPDPSPVIVIPPLTPIERPDPDDPALRGLALWILKHGGNP